MAEGFKDYVWECLREVPSAFRRGVILVTILANVILAVGLYLGWHLNALTPFQISSVAILIAILEIILILPYRLWKANKTEIAQLRAVGDPIPDWSLRELFYFIDPNAIDSDVRLRIGRDVLDRLATHQLFAWGRLASRDRANPLTSIYNNFWADADFTFWFLAEGADDSIHAYKDGGIERTSYCDIRVDRSQAMRVWRK
jgi:hypothetical protein